MKRWMKSSGTTPAMAAGLTDTPHSWEWFVDSIEARAKKPNRPKDYASHRNISN